MLRRIRSSTTLHVFLKISKFYDFSARFKLLQQCRFKDFTKIQSGA